MILAVGTTTLLGSIEKYPLDLLEVQVTPLMPRASVLSRYRAARPELALCLRLQADGSTALASSPDLARAKEAASPLAPLAIVLSTGPRFAPTEARRRDLALAVGSLAKVARFVAWEPRGVWQASEAEAWAEEVGAILARDLTLEEAPRGAICYARVRQLGMQSRITQGVVERLAERLADKEEAYVVVEGDGARNLRGRLSPLLASEGLA